MFFNVFSRVSTRKPAAPTTPLEQQPSKLRGAVQYVLEALQLRRSTPKQHPSTETKNPKIIFTCAVPLTTATPSTTASVVALASISPLFLEEVYARTMRDSGRAGRAAASDDEGCHRSNSDERGREPSESDSIVWYKRGGHRASLFGSDDSCWDDFYPPGPSTQRPEPRGTGEDGDYDDELNPNMSPRRPEPRY